MGDVGSIVVNVEGCGSDVDKGDVVDIVDFEGVEDMGDVGVLNDSVVMSDVG